MPHDQLAVHAMPVGAEIAGLAPGDEADPRVRETLYRAWLDHGILLFRGVDSVEWHLALSRVFGELEIHPFAAVRSAVHPMFIDIGGAKRSPAYVFDGDEIRSGRLPWHRDTAYTPEVCKGAMLRMVEAPASEGETLLADTAMAWDALPPALKARLEGLDYQATLRLDPVSQTRPGAFWRSARPATAAEDPEGGHAATYDPASAAGFPSVIQPAVIAHPESHRRCIFLSPTYVDRFLGLDQAESDALLGALVSHMLQPRFVYRHAWRANDAILWDNRRSMHASMGCKMGDTRFGLRTTLAGAMRTGRYLDDDGDAAAFPAMAD